MLKRHHWLTISICGCAYQGLRQFSHALMSNSFLQALWNNASAFASAAIIASAADPHEPMLPPPFTRRIFMLVISGPGDGIRLRRVITWEHKDADGSNLHRPKWEDKAIVTASKNTLQVRLHLVHLRVNRFYMGPVRGVQIWRRISKRWKQFRNVGKILRHSPSHWLLSFLPWVRRPITWIIHAHIDDPDLLPGLLDSLKTYHDAIVHEILGDQAGRLTIWSVGWTQLDTGRGAAG
jgi:hypothetical protein